MVIHVGIDPYFGKVATYNTETRAFDNFDIVDVNIFEYDANKIDDMFKEIRSKIHGEFGCACIYANLCSYKFRKAFVDFGLLHGFEKIQLIGFDELIFLNALSQSKYNHENSNIILICWNSKVYVWQKENGIFKRKHTFFVGEQNFDFKKHGEVNPKIIYFNDDYLYNEHLKNHFPDFEYVYYIHESISFGALFYARIMGNDPDIFHLKTEFHFSDIITLWVDKNKLLEIELRDGVPITKSVEFKSSKKNNILQVNYGHVFDFEEETLKLPNFENTLITITVDENGIYSVKFTDISNFNINTATSFNFPAKIQINDDGINAIGIDLGTSRCCTAVNRRNGIETVALDLTGQRLLPSYVGYDEAHEKCGQLVVDRLRNYACSTVFDVKRIIGKDYDKIEIDDGWPFTIEIDQQNCEDKCKKYLIKTSRAEDIIFKRPEEVSAVLLKHIKQRSEEFQDRELSDVVITVPAAFDDDQKIATCHAAKLAGWKKICLLPEPVAAAFAYFIDGPIPNNSNLLLFDLGGGTLDICIFRIQKNQLKIISNNGDPNLGGRDFDNLLVSYFKQKLENDFGVEVYGSKKYKLMQECQKVKENLSGLDKDNFEVDTMNPAVEENIPITRDEFEEMSAVLLSRIRKHIQTALNKINIGNNEINKVLHVGGGCRMPMIQKLLQDIFPNSEHIRQQNLDEVVAVGAAYYSYYLNLATGKSLCSVM